MRKTISILLVLLMALSFAPMAFADEGEGEAEPVLISADEGETCAEQGETCGTIAGLICCEGLECNYTEDPSTVADAGGICVEEEAEEEIDEETQEEIEAMDSPYGAEVRLLQLESSIARNIERGNEVIAKAKELEKDTSELESIIAEMEALKEEVAAADPAAEDAVQVFVDLKKDAIDLSKQFRDKAREIMPANEANRLRERIRNENIGEQTSLKERIRERLKEFNALRLGAIFQKMNMNGQEIIEKIKNGEITAKEVKAQTMEKFKSMTAEERKDAFAAAKEEGVKRAVASRAKADKLRVRYIERKETRLAERLEKLEGTGKNAELLIKYSEKRLQKLNETKARIQSRIEERQQGTVSTETQTSGQGTGSSAAGGSK